MADLERLYAAIDDEAAYEDIPATLARLCGGRSATVTRIGADGALAYGRMSYWSPEHWESYYAQGFYDADPWRAAAEIFGTPGRPFIADDALPPERFRETVLYNEFMRNIGDDTARCAGIVWPSDDGFLMLGVHRAATAPAFTDRNAVLIDVALVHLRRVFRSRDAIAWGGTAHELDMVMLDQAGRAMAVVDRTLRVLRMTRSARAIVDRGDGIRHLRGRLELDDPSAHHLLQAAVNGVVGRNAGMPGALLCPRRATPLSWRIAVLPAGDRMGAYALLILDDPTER